MRPEVLWDGLRGNGAIVGCEETVKYFFEYV